MKTNKYERILHVSTKLIARKGYDRTSLKEIANKVGLHKSTLFHYCENKEQLLLAILEKPIKEVDESLRKIVDDKELKPEEKLRKAIEIHLTLLTKHLDSANVYLNESRGLSKKNRSAYLLERKKYEKNFEKIIRGMKKEGYFERADSKIITLGVLGMLNWVVKWYKKGGRLPIGEIGDNFYRVIVEGGGKQICS